MFIDCRKRKRSLVRLRFRCRRRCRTDVRLDPLRILSLNLFLTIKQRLHRSLPWSSFIGIKRFLNTTKHDVQWNALLLPRLHQRPIHRAKKQMLAAPADECILDFGEVVEVVQANTYPALPRSYTMRKPSSVRVSSIASIYCDASAINRASPPVAITRGFAFISAIVRSNMPSTSPA